MFKITIYVRPRDGFKFKEWFEEEELVEMSELFESMKQEAIESLAQR